MIKTERNSLLKNALHLLLLLLLAGCSSSRLPTLRYGEAEEVGMDAGALESAVALFRQAVEDDDLRGVVLLVARFAEIGPEEEPGTSYSYGWNVSKEGVYSHGGSDGTFAWVDPNLEVISLVFTQSPRGGSNPRSEFVEMVTASVSEPDLGNR